MLALDNHWVWDSWYAEHDGTHHAFFLHAPKSLKDPNDRHFNAVIGHATSDDLTDWTIHPPALLPSAQGWDDKATWTGCVIPDPAGGWLMFYTGLSHAEAGLIQRIGVATSTDLHTWHRPAEPLLIADPRWYEAQNWRDPWVFRGEDGRWHMMITASAAGWPDDTGGVIGHAVSDDLHHWQAGEPLTEPGEHRCLEVTQVVEVEGQLVLVYSVPRAETDGTPLPLGDTRCARAASQIGPFDLANSWRFDESGRYAGRLVRRTQGWVLMGFINAPDGEFVGVIDDPQPVPRLPRNDPGQG